ncbi:MAG: TIR domain-containing protein [Pseudonocardiaceae bacterium]
MPEQERTEIRPEEGVPKPHGAAGYDAFLSYSHAADGRLAPAVQRGLHQLAKPWYRMRASRVFRDQLSLSANPDLWGSIAAALRDSRFFVLMASPESAASPWVQREVEFWQTHRGPDTFLIVLTEGTIVWDPAACDFDWDRTTALPQRLRGWFRTEPLWVRLDWARQDTDLSLRHNRFRSAVATLAAPIRSVAKDELDSEDVRQHRRTTRVRHGAITVLVLLTAISLVLGVVANQQAHRAQAALVQAVSRELAIRSQTLGDADPGVSTLLSVAAWRLDPTPDARAAMITAFSRPGLGEFPGGGGPVALSPDGRTLATGDGHTVRLWDALRHTPLGALLTGHTDDVGTVKFSRDGTRLATGSADGTVRLWDAASHRQLGAPLRPDAGPVVAVTFSPNGHTIAVGGFDGTMRLWDVATHRQLGEPFTGYQTGAVPFSPDGRTLAFFGTDGAVHLYDVASHQQLGTPLGGFVGEVVALAFSPDGRLLATGGSDGGLRLWEVASHRQVGDSLLGFRGGLASGGIDFVAFSADGGTVTATGLDGTVRSWDVASQTPVGDALNTGSALAAAGFSADGDTLATSGQKGSLWLWNLTARNHRGTPLGTGSPGAYAAVFSPDGRTLATADASSTVRLWDNTSRTQRSAGFTDFAGRAITSMAFSPDGRRLATGDNSGPLQVWDVTTRTPLGTPLPDAGEPVAFTPDDRILITSGGELWDIAAHRRVARFRAADDNRSAAMSRDGRLVATGGYDGTVRLWDIGTRRQTGQIVTGPGEPVSSLAFSPDGRALATGDNLGTVRLWDVGARAPLGDPLTGFPGSQVLSLAFSPDGTSLAASAEDGTAQLWDVASRAQVGPIPSHYGEHVNTVAFSPDSRTLATSNGNGAPAVWLWEIPPLARIDSVLCTRAGRSLTPHEWQRYIPELPYEQICR